MTGGRGIWKGGRRGETLLEARSRPGYAGPNQVNRLDDGTPDPKVGSEGYSNQLLLKMDGV